MRRALASLLLAVFSFLLIAPVAFADPESNLPACCRRDGAHRCSMGSMDDEVSGAGLHAALDRCPAFPIDSASPTGPDFTLAKEGGVVFGSELSYPSVPFQTESLFSCWFSRSHQKRGPPAAVAQ